jgi:pyruvate dehydrogenase E1 component beta subunit
MFSRAFVRNDTLFESDMQTLSIAKALNQAHRIALQDNEHVFVIGQDVGEYGGVYKVTDGLLAEFGRSRVRDTPISEAAITGASVGAALVGTRPILEVGFVDFASTCFDQIVNQAAKYCYLSGGRTCVPMTIRMTCGAAGLGYGVHHSQSLEAWFTHTPGLKVVMPSNAADAKGLLLAAIEDPNPVIFMEHRALYQLKGEVPEGRYMVPIGTAKVCRSGTDVTIVAWSQSVHWTMAAAQRAAEAHDISCEVIDLRSLAPLDKDAVMVSVRKTGRLIVCHEACRTGGFGAEIVARVVEDAFDWLDAPPVRVAAPDIPVPSSIPLEQFYLLPRHDIDLAIRQLVGNEIR